MFASDDSGSTGFVPEVNLERLNLETGAERGPSGGDQLAVTMWAWIFPSTVPGP